jgi:hypothetical protein
MGSILALVGIGLSVWCGSVLAASWEPGPNLNLYRHDAAVVTDAQGRIWAIGGVDVGHGPAVVHKSVDVLDENIGLWKSGVIPNLNGPRSGAKAVRDSLGRIYVIGGNNGVQTLDTVERFDPLDGRWETLSARLRVPRVTFGVVILKDDMIIIFGGASVTYTRSAEKYVPSQNQWTSIASMVTARDYPGAALDAQGRIYAIGGQNTASLRSVERYDPAANQWQKITDIPDRGHSGPGAFFFDGKVWVIGGWDNQMLNSCQLFDVASGTWSNGPAMYEGFTAAGTAQGLSGYFYLVGGQRSGGMSSNHAARIPMTEPVGNWFVDDNAPGDPGLSDPLVSDPLEDGSRVHPFDTIQEGIDRAVNGDTVWVQPGRYVEEIKMNGTAITVRNVSQPPILEAPGGFAVSAYMGEGPQTVLRNFVITNSDIGIFSVNSAMTLDHLTVVKNLSGLEAFNVAPWVTNSIFWFNNSGDLLNCQARYSCIEHVADSAGVGNITADPLFVDPAAGNYHLRSQRGHAVDVDPAQFGGASVVWVMDGRTSPCIDAGDPDSLPDTEPVPHGGRTNMGAYGNTPYASLSRQSQSGDLNGDGRVDLLDFALFAQNWLQTSGPQKYQDMVWVSINDPGVSGYEAFKGLMSKYETTNAQYCQFLNAALASGDITVSGDTVLGANGSNSGADFAGQIYYNLAGPGYSYTNVTNGGAARINWTGSSFMVDPGFENHPVTYVSWYGATAFCNYYGYRLPTKWEWHAVADYDGSFIFGCGTTINNSIANYSGSIHPEGTTTVGAFGAYGYGMCDMAGDVFEWTSTPDGMYYFDCGGSFYDASQYCQISFCRRNPPIDNNWDLGFRAVLNINVNSGLIGYWKINDGSGGIAADSSGNGNNGTISGATWTVGKSGSALSFDGVDDSVQVPQGLTGNPTSASFAYWVNITQWNKVGFILINSDVNVPRPISSAIGWDSGDTRISAYFGDATGIVTSTTYLQTGQWYHVAATYDGSVAKLYVNGTLEASARYAKTLAWQGPFWLGRRADFDGNYPFNGLIDEVRIYSRALTDNEVEYLYQNP